MRRRLVVLASIVGVLLVLVGLGHLVGALDFFSPAIDGVPGRLPDACRGNFVGRADWDRLTVYFDGGMSNGSFDRRSLLLVEGRETTTGYEATRVVLVETRWRHPLRSFLSPITECTGTARFASGVWTLDLVGLGCMSYSGVYRAEVDEPERLATPEPPPDAEPVIVLPPPSSAFARALAAIPTLTLGEAPCPVALHAPPAEVAFGSSLGDDAYHDALEEPTDGARFGIVRATSGEELPSEPDGHRRYQAVYVRVVHRDPEVVPGASEYIPGRSRGRAFLVDTETSTVVCAGDVSAESGSSVSGATERDARMWLALQFGVIETRAIALAMRAAE